MPREVLLNSWEGSFLAFGEKTLTDMMDGVAEMGGEMFVMDDGWFGEGDIARDHNAGDESREGVCDSALGDWVVNRRKLPRGLKYLTSEAARRGLKFGIWVEPEMVNIGKSSLHARIPQCHLQVKGRPVLVGRGGTQTVLDFSNPKVVDDLFAQLDALYSEPGVSYIKWDANANIFNPGSTYLDSESQGNVWFDYTCGVYDLMSRLLKAHPKIVTQACASGGGRMDYGALRYCDEFWVSDDTDARERVFMQWGALYFYPASAQASHVTVVPNKQTGRSTPLKFRFDVAMSGRLGFELNPKNMSKEDIAFAKACVADYKRLRNVIQGGDLHRLVSPYGSSYASLMYVSKDKSQAVVFVWGLNRGPNREFPARIRLRGLDSGRNYHIREINRILGSSPHVTFDGHTVSGAALMNFGFEPMLSSGDYDSCVIVLTREDMTFMNGFPRVSNSCNGNF
jgi:alpha-galactosidase